jgi:hypothetical protein
VKSQIHRGRPFSCPHCGAHIVVPKGSARLAIAIFALLTLLSKQIPLLVVISIGMIVMLVESLLVKVARTDASPPA